MKAVDDQYSNGLLAPGVHFREVALPKGQQLQTGVPLFVGFGELTGTERSGKTDTGQTEVFRPTDQEDFNRFFKPGTSGGYLDYAIRGFFENGGQDCVVVALPEIEEGYARKRALEKLFEEKGLLEDIEDVDLVCVPDIMGKEILSLHDAAVDLQRQVLAYCRRMEDRFALLDADLVPGPEETNIRNITTADYRQELVRHVLDWQANIPHKGRAVEGAVYFPWIRVKPLLRHHNDAYVSIPPCGHVAGIYARSDREFGVHKAPANEIVEGAMDLECHVSKELQAELNKFGINCLRSFPGRGIRVWGARTLSSQTSWKYINVRRLFLTFVRWIMHNLDDMLFEPNEPSLWDNVTDRAGAYCYELYQHGALKGLSPEEAYFVKCDAETNPIEVREAGQMICEVGLAPVVPAEFVVVRIVKNLSGTTATLSTSI